MVKPYRIKHKASGYFYQRYNGSNLGKKGKVYMNNQSPLTMCDNENFIRIQIRHNTLAYKALGDMLSKFVIGKDDECEWHSTSYRVPKSEFEKEELQLMKSVFSMFSYWDRVHQFPDGHIKVERNFAWRRKHLRRGKRVEKLNFQRMKEKILNLAKSAVWFVLCLLVGALIFEGIRSLANSNYPAKDFGTSVFTKKGHDYLLVDTKHGVCVIHAESCPCRKKEQL